jgi:hypothetical protein
MKRMAIGIGPRGRIDPFKRLLAALEKVFPVSFESRSGGDFRGLNALVLLTGDVESAEAAGRSGLPCYVVSTNHGVPERGHRAGIQLSVHPLVFDSLRGRVMLDSEDEAVVPITVQACDEVLLSRDGRALWVYRPADAKRLHVVALAPPKLADGEVLGDYFNGRRFLRLLPLMHFLRWVTRPVAWKEMPLRACFIFDDPSLLRTSYGCLDYRQLADHARAHRYHAVIATIPLEARWASERVSTIFRGCEAQLSLLIHGNNHTWRELAQRRSTAENLALLAQALRRVGEFEHRHGLKICRIMEPPFGVIGDDMLTSLERLGYEGVMIDPEQYLQCNRATHTAPSADLSATGWLSGGLCCIPRIRVASPWWRNEVALAAFMGVPLALVGHHCDAKGGLSLLSDVAATVNGLGHVVWSSLTGIVRANYRARCEGATITVRMGSRRVLVPVPDGVQAMIVERPWLNGQGEALQVVGGLNLVAGETSEAIPVQGRTMLDIVSPDPAAIDPAALPAPAGSLWAVARRLLTETRDRLYPYVPKTDWLSGLSTRQQ